MRFSYNNPFEVEGDWFKGNIHAHTLDSDGSYAPSDVVRFYRESGYDFLSITDHGILTDTSSFTSPRFLAIPGEELCVGHSVNGRFTHIVALNIREELPVADFNREMSPQEAIDLISDLGGSAIVAHPYWSDLNVNDLAVLEGALGIEVYNSTCEYDVGRGHSSVHWDDLLVMGKRLFGFAVDDTHGRTREYLPKDYCKAWISVKASALTAEEVMKSINRGLFYSSTGPSIKDIRVEGDAIFVKSSAARSIAFISNTALGMMYTAEEGSLEDASYELTGREIYVRVEITDKLGRKAWSNPIYVEK
ncbi:MAG: CehA/McbA family metallohydrolase [Candidatus Bathyarchaeia archaeon]